MERSHLALFSVLLMIVAGVFFVLSWSDWGGFRIPLLAIVFAAISLAGGILTIITYALSAKDK